MIMRPLCVALIAALLIANLSFTSADQASVRQLKSDKKLQPNGRQLLSLRQRAGWLLGRHTKRDKTKATRRSYIDLGVNAQKLKEGRAVDLAALLELKALVRYVPDASDFDTWMDGGNPCKFAKVSCNQETGRVSEIDLIFEDNLPSQYPELQTVISQHATNLSQQSDIASVRRHSHRLLADTADDLADEPAHDSADDSTGRPSWHVPDLPSSAIPWPPGLYYYNATVLDSLPKGPAFMKLNQTLRKLHISNAVFLDSTLPSSWSQLIGLRELTLHKSNLAGTLPSGWAGMINMTQLLLGDNPALHGTLPPEWGAMRKLRTLDLSLSFDNGLRSNLGGSLPPSWASMHKLEILDLWRTSVEGPLPSSWAALKNLQVLVLSDTGISGSLPGAWSKMRKLKAVHLANTRIDGKLPTSWGSLPSLALLDLQGTDIVQPVPSSWHTFCKRNGTRVWDKDLLQYTWPNNLKHGKVAFVKFPWAGPDGRILEINHNNDDANNCCHNLAIAHRARLLVIVTGCVCGLTVLLCSIWFMRRTLHAKL